MRKKHGDRCPRCSKKFYYKGNLYKHMIKKHKVDYDNIKVEKE